MLSGYEAYLRSHQQEKHDADERWQNATPEEWKAGRLGNSFCATVLATHSYAEMTDKMKEIIEMASLLPA